MADSPSISRNSPLIAILFVLAGLCDLHAQVTITDLRLITPFHPDSSYYLGEWVLPGSVRVRAGKQEIPRSHWHFDEYSGLWELRESSRQQYTNVDTVRIGFEAYPMAIRRTYQNRRVQRLDSSFFRNDTDSLSRALISRSTETAFKPSQLQQRGSLSRGIIVGSNQDFALESGLNFELSGQLTDDVSINASLTDRSIPFQPDGTTQNIREFDRVFIQLQAPNTTIEMGDVDVSFEQSTFARLNRRLQGAAGYTSSRYGDYNAALSVVRGIFKSQSFQGRDGVQGPYRLTGREDEEFVIILAGTENVYVNGQRVQRGEENEYIIDYGLGEVYFSNNLLIKDETRIVIEYEYADQNFNRTLVAAEATEEFLDGRFRIGTSVIRQADSDELLSQQTLSEEDIAVLRDAGDDLDRAAVPGERLAGEEDDNSLRYAKVDTTLNGQMYSIFKNIPGSSESRFVVRFSKVEEGTGSYRRVSGTVNGLLYEWVGPEGGNYEPFRRLPTPEQQKMVALNSSFSLSETVMVYGEFAASSFDRNRFSALDDDDNNDLSYLSGVRVTGLETGVGTIKASAFRRYTGQNFRFFERTREVEFDRKWNIIRTGETEETINEAKFEFRPAANTIIGGEYGLIDRPSFSGYRQAAQFGSNEPGILSAEYEQDWVRSEDRNIGQNGTWFRHKGRVGKQVAGVVTPYLSFEQERREQRSAESDSLINNSLAFFEAGPGIEYSKNGLELGAGLVYREDERVLENRLQNESKAIEQRYRLDYRPSAGFGTQNEVAFRSKDFTNAFEQQGSTNRNGLLIRSVTDYRSADEAVSGQLFYEANTRRQATLQEAYIEVGPELGQFVWIDSNEDGVQQIDEFFPELSPNEGMYVRQYLPSDELFPAIDLNVRFRNEITPFARFSDRSAASELLKGIRFSSRINITENSTTENLSDVYLLKLNTFRNDSTTIGGRIFWEQQADLFTENPDLDVTGGYTQSRGLNQRSSESQRTYSELIYADAKFSLTERLRVSLALNSSRNEARSDRLASRNFDIRSYSVSPSAELLVNRNWQTSVSGSYAYKTDRLPATDVEASVLKLSNNHRAFLWRKVQANGRLELRNASVSGNSSALGTFELTEGTGEGTHLIWSLGGSYRVTDLIRVSVNYDGRTVKDRPDIHTAKVVISAVF